MARMRDFLKYDTLVSVLQFFSINPCCSSSFLPAGMVTVITLLGFLTVRPPKIPPNWLEILTSLGVFDAFLVRNPNKF